MGEVVVSSEEGMEMRWWKPKKDSSNSSDVVRWERLLPRMSLTVLLVEADDSTRQIITALLRKCGYRVTAVPDGLKAWETLKGRPHNIDLILTEVELPSISGFALLTLIMEHDICKNIPVIMMSSHDSISIVLKCMLKAAADFLIKPVRRNELRNLWQHVWRRHTPTGGHVPQNLAVAKQKVEATSENNAASNHSSDYVASIQKNKECSEKGSDAQSSCTTPCLEAESTYMQNMQGLSTLKCRCASNLSNMEIERREKRVKLDKESLVPESETGGKSIRLGPEVAPCNEAYDSTALRLEEDQSSAKTITRNEGVGPESQRGNANITDEIYGCNDEQIEPFRGAIDLIGTFDNRPKCTNGQLGSNDGTKKHIFAPHLELSLRRFHSSSSKNQGTDERHTLNHSNASAFSWYNNSKTLQPLFPTSANSCTQQKEGAIDSQKQLSNQVSENTVGSPQWHGTASSNSQESMTTLVVGQSGQAEAAFPSPQVGIIPVPEIRFDSLRAGYGHIFPPIFYTQSGLPPVWSPKSACQREQSPFPMSSSLHSYPEVYNSEQGYCPLDETTNNSTDQTLHEQQNKLESVGELRHGSPAADQSVSSSLCNGVLSHLNSSVYGSICNRNDVNASQAAAVARVTTPESVNDEGLFSHDGLSGMDSHCSTQREAALSKFRLKRKDRCYEKKVRYQSRKRLAEQRPRIKGQFVRQVQADHPPAGVLVAPEIRYDHLLHCHQSEFSKLPRGRS